MKLVQRYQVLIPGTCVYYHNHRKILTVVTMRLPWLSWLLQKSNHTVLTTETSESLLHTQETATWRQKPRLERCHHKPRDTGNHQKWGGKGQNPTYILKRNLCPANSWLSEKWLTKVWPPDQITISLCCINHQVEANLLQQSRVSDITPHQGVFLRLYVTNPKFPWLSIMPFLSYIRLPYMTLALGFIICQFSLISIASHELPSHVSCVSYLAILIIPL